MGMAKQKTTWSSRVRSSHNNHQMASCTRLATRNSLLARLTIVSSLKTTRRPRRYNPTYWKIWSQVRYSSLITTHRQMLGVLVMSRGILLVVLLRGTWITITMWKQRINWTEWTLTRTSTRRGFTVAKSSNLTKRLFLTPQSPTQTNTVLEVVRPKARASSITQPTTQISNITNPKKKSTPSEPNHTKTNQSTITLSASHYRQLSSWMSRYWIIRAVVTLQAQLRMIRSKTSRCSRPRARDSLKGLSIKGMQEMLIELTYNKAIPPTTVSWCFTWRQYNKTTESR